MNYFLVGIKGSGMASLAHILLDKGYNVSGCDTLDYVYTQDDLFNRNVKIYNFDEYEYKKEDIVIFGHSFKDSIEVDIARFICDEVYEYHEFLNRIIKESKLSIGISGSHGKTWTTGLISFILDKLTNVSYLIGDGEGKYNGNDIFIFEACEYMDHFLVYECDICLVLNIDYDHVDYFKCEEDYIKSFEKFCNKSKLCILNKDDVNINKLNTNNKIYYSMKDIDSLYLNKEGYSFKYNNNLINTNIYGDKHISNLIGIITLFNYLNIDINDYKEYLNKFNGVKRRFKEIIINGDIYIDDYAHHPTQIAYTLDMIKNKYNEKEIIVFFKPDRASRFLTFNKEFATSFNNIDKVVLIKNKDINVNLLIKENPKKFIKYNKRIIKRIRSIKNKVVVSFSSKNMKDVYESIFIN